MTAEHPSTRDSRPSRSPSGLFLPTCVWTKDRLVVEQEEQRLLTWRTILNDLIGQALRCVRGIEVTPESLALETMKSVCLEGPGHYLGADQTLRLMQSDHVYPTLGDRTSPKEWAEKGKPGLVEKASKRKHEILAKRSAARFDDATDARIRARFPIHLAP